MDKSGKMRRCEVVEALFATMCYMLQAFCILSWIWLQPFNDFEPQSLESKSADWFAFGKCRTVHASRLLLNKREELSEHARQNWRRASSARFCVRDWRG